jgi:hypothetical protein
MFEIPLHKALEEALDDESVLLKSIRDNNYELYLTSHVQANDEDALKAAEIFEHNAGFELSHHHIKRILDLYPRARITLATFRVEAATPMLLDAFANFFLGCRWPQYGDLHREGVATQDKFIHMDQFRAALRSSAMKMGLSRG